jgi:hypothetical protein
MSTTRYFKGFTVTVGNLSGKDVQGGWVIEEISVNGSPVELKPTMYDTEDGAFLIAKGIGNSAVDKLKRR